MEPGSGPHARTGHAGRVRQAHPGVGGYGSAVPDKVKAVTRKKYCVLSAGKKPGLLLSTSGITAKRKREAPQGFSRSTQHSVPSTAFPVARDGRDGVTRQKYCVLPADCWGKSQAYC